MKTYLLIYSILAIHATCSLEARWLDRKAEGWAWYEEREKKETREDEKTEDILPPPPVQQSSYPYLEKLDKFKKDYEEHLAKAVLEPTEENVAQLMVEQKKRLDQSTTFSKLWSQILLKYPELDESVTGFPVTQYGIQLQKQAIEEQRESFIKSLAQESGLFFFYEGSSKASLGFAFVVKEFAKKYHWQILAICVDGIQIDEFENHKFDNGISKKWAIKQYPSLYIVYPQSQEIIPIAFGLSTIDQIESNIALQFSLNERLVHD